MKSSSYCKWENIGDCYYLDEEEGVCWGKVDYVDSIMHGDSEEQPIYLCEGHLNFWPNTPRTSQYIPESR